MTRYFALILAFVAAPVFSDEPIMLKCDYKQVSKGGEVVKNGREYTTYYRIVGDTAVDRFNMDKESWSRYFYDRDLRGEQYVDISVGAIEFGEYQESNVFTRIRIDRRTSEYKKSEAYLTPVARYQGACSPSVEPTLSKPKF